MKHTTGTHGDAQEEFETAKQAVLEAYANFLDAKKHLKKAALAAGVEFRESANEQLEEVMTRADSAGDYVRENPLASAGIAFLSGVVLSRLLGK
jgi:ElaB/YqjD/DUF883 family membrane-anchored ribosome-binding protein